MHISQQEEYLQGHPDCASQGTGRDHYGIGRGLCSGIRVRKICPLGQHARVKSILPQWAACDSMIQDVGASWSQDARGGRWGREQQAPVGGSRASIALWSYHHVTSKSRMDDAC